MSEPQRDTSGPSLSVFNVSGAPQENSVRELVTHLLEIERQHDLLEWEVRGVHPWALMRMQIYYQLTRELGLFGAPHGTSRWRGRIRRRIGMWTRAAFSHLTMRRQPRPILVFDHSRKVRVDDLWVDIYTQSLIQQLNQVQTLQDAPLFEVYEYLSYQSVTHADRDHPRRYTDLILSITRKRAALWPLSLSPTERAKLKTVEDEIEARLGVRLKLSRPIISAVKRFILQRRAYRNLLIKHQAQVVVCVVAYSHAISALISAARSLGIPTVEIQHGTLSPFHLGYHYPDRSTPYFCDYLLTFGEFWSGAASFPLPAERLKVSGFAHLHRQLNAYTQQTRQRPRSGVLWLSQGVISQALTEYALATAQATPGLHHTYKLHPSEYKTWRHDYPLLARAADDQQITVIDNAHQSLYELMWHAEYQVGVFSTAMYEGLTLGCYTFVVDLPGAEYMERLIAQEIVTLCRTPQELIEHLRHPPRSRSTPEPEPTQYFAPEQPHIAEWLIELAQRRGKD